MKISVVTGTYNQADKIEKLYASLLENKDFLQEWIVCDDGSTDGTWEKIQHLAGLGEIKMEAFAQLNKGSRLGKSLNNGLRGITGDVIFIVMGDSYLNSNTLEEITKTFIPGTAGCGVRINVNEKGEKVSYDWRVLDGSTDIREVTNEPYPYAFLTGNSMIVDAKLLDHAHWPENYIGYGCEDLAVFFNLWVAGSKLYQYNGVKINHIDHPATAENPDNQRRFNEHVTLLVDKDTLLEWNKKTLCNQ